MGVTRSVHLERPVTDCGICDVADVGSRAKFQKSQTVNIGRRDRSVKKVSVNTPTSEQLSSLNLKEGRNTITFCFSTPMMGMRQVSNECNSSLLLFADKAYFSWEIKI